MHKATAPWLDFGFAHVLLLYTREYDQFIFYFNCLRQVCTQGANPSEGAKASPIGPQRQDLVKGMQGVQGGQFSPPA